MVLDVVNVSLVKFQNRELEGEEISAEMMKAVKDEDIRVPVVLRCGDVDYTIGGIYRIRRGREEVFGDHTLDIQGSLEYEIVRDENGEITGVKPRKYVYKFIGYVSR